MKGIRRNSAGPTAAASGYITKTRSVQFRVNVQRTPIHPCPLAGPFKGMFRSNGPLRPETSPHLLLGAWCEDAGLLGGRWVLSTSCHEFLTQLIWGLNFIIENLTKKLTSSHTSHVSNQHTPFPWTSVINPESRFSPPLKGGRLYRIPDLTVAHPQVCC